MKLFTVNNARKVSGCEENQLDLARWFRDERGDETVFLVREMSDLGDRADAEGFKVKRVFSDGLGRIKTPFAIAETIKDEQPDIISVNREHNIYATWIGIQLARPFLKETPLAVAVFHSPTGRRYPLLNKFDGVICTSEYTGESFFQNNQGLRERTKIIPYGTLLPLVDQDAKENDSRPKRIFKNLRSPLVGMIGDLWKNQSQLIDVANMLRSEHPELTFVVVGAGSDEIVAELKSKVVRLGLQDRFIITGRVERSKIPDLFFDLDISLSTYTHEGFGIVHIESLAAMTPLIAYNSGGIREIIRYGGGILVDGNTDEFAAAISELISDSCKRRTLGRKGRQVVEKYFTMEIMCRNHHEYYDNILKNKLRINK
ncbi:MAG: glycosyltransferase family 4 protein [Desulfuromonadaceae bacterium]|nr:glycosyltransferase family 4 protein [Desulfuromonadaceae bacterium]MDD2856859.1 glycosyltransferase family 4 protein [Desulfuromonadaceae bacterium]